MQRRSFLLHPSLFFFFLEAVLSDRAFVAALVPWNSKRRYGQHYSKMIAFGGGLNKSLGHTAHDNSWAIILGFWTDSISGQLPLACFNLKLFALKYLLIHFQRGFPCGLTGKESACSVWDLGSIPGLGRSPGEGKGHPLQSSGLENSWTIQSMGSQRVTTEWLSLS